MNSRTVSLLVLWAMCVGLITGETSVNLTSASGPYQPPAPPTDVWSPFLPFNGLDFNPQTFLSRLGLDGLPFLTGSKRKVDAPFNCTGRGHGYYADVEKECQTFSLCYDSDYYLPQSVAVLETVKISFSCDVGTRFDQKVQSCVESPSIPCNESTTYYPGPEKRMNPLNISSIINQTENALFGNNSSVNQFVSKVFRVNQVV